MAGDPQRRKLREGSQYAVDASTGTFDSLTTDNISTENIGVNAHPTSGQNIPHDTVVRVNIDSISGLNDENISVDFSNNKFVVEKGGKYTITGAGRVSPDSNWTDGDRIQLRLMVNGEVLAETYGRKSGIDGQSIPVVSKVSELSQNDTIYLETYQDSGGYKGLTGGDGRATFIEVMRIG